MTKYTYDHPEQSGFGQHHAEGDLKERPAQPPEVAQSMRGVLSMIDPTEEQEAKLEAFLGRSMHDLDMHHGTVVDHVGTDDAGQELVTWTDQHGDVRTTAVSKAQFSQHFKPVTEPDSIVGDTVEKKEAWS